MKNKKTILYVDDEPINLQLFEYAFNSEFNIISAENGDRGLEQLKQNKDISVVISDMKMPGMNGIEFIKSASINFPDVCYFILTGFDINDEISEALNNKLIKKYFSKPFNINQIKKEIYGVESN